LEENKERNKRERRGRDGSREDWKERKGWIINKKLNKKDESLM